MNELMQRTYKTHVWDVGHELNSCTKCGESPISLGYMGDEEYISTHTGWKNPCRMSKEKKIDIGCGGTRKRAEYGYDVYTDVIDPKEVLPGVYVKCPMEEMPFNGKEFDYARCHHVLEHVQDPDKACSELIRIAKAGIISFPPMQAEIQFGRRDHNWFVCIDKGRLLFIKKRHPSYGVPRRVTMCELNVNFSWEGGFQWQCVE